MSDTRAYWSASFLARRWSVNRTTIYKWIDTGLLPAHRIGPRSIRIYRDEILAFEEHQLSRKSTSVEDALSSRVTRS